MRISLNWLADFVHLPKDTSSEDIAHKLTMLGLEVEAIEHIEAGNDTVLHLSVTPNRADALSHLGVARDLAAAYGLHLREAVVRCNENGGDAHTLMQINVHRHRFHCTAQQQSARRPSPDPGARQRHPGSR